MKSPLEAWRAGCRRAPRAGQARPHAAPARPEARRRRLPVRRRRWRGAFEAGGQPEERKAWTRNSWVSGLSAGCGKAVEVPHACDQRVEVALAQRVALVDGQLDLRVPVSYTH